MNQVKSFKFASLPCLAVWLAPWLCSATLQAGELVYTPTNPTFGGSPSNASGLLAVATAQNDHKAYVAPKEPKEALSELDKFTAAVQSSIMSRLRRDAVDQLYPENAIPTLNTDIDIGNFTVRLAQEEGKPLIMITTDKNTGQKTEIVVGSYNETIPAAVTP